jgi:hypothetical protein
MPGINFSHQCRNNKEKWPPIRKGWMQAMWREYFVPMRSIRQRSPLWKRPTCQAISTGSWITEDLLALAVSPGDHSLRISQMYVCVWALQHLQLFAFAVAIEWAGCSHFTDAGPFSAEVDLSIVHSQWYFLSENQVLCACTLIWYWL